MYEVEVKVPAEHGPIRERLASLNAKLIDAVCQEDTYYDAPHRSFVETDEALRIRRERPLDAEEWTAAVTYKGPLVDDESKSREEAETVVDDGETMATVLERLGFDPVATVRKERERYRFGEYVVTLDAVDGVGEYVEVETDVDTSDSSSSTGPTDGSSTAGPSSSDSSTDGPSAGDRAGGGPSAGGQSSGGPSAGDSPTDGPSAGDRSADGPSAGSSSPDSIERAREGAFDRLHELGLDPADSIRTSYLELLLDG